MNETDDRHQVPADVRAAINAFLNECEKNAQPFVVSKALNAVRGIFPDLDISDADLMDAITSEASIAGLDINFDTPATPETVKQKAIERWDNEGGAIGSSSQQPKRSGA